MPTNAAMTSAPTATLAETRITVIRTLNSLKRDSSGNPLPSWREESRSIFTVEVQSEAGGRNDKSFSLPLQCAAFHQDFSIPLTLRCSDHNRLTRNVQNVQQTVPEVQFLLSLGRLKVLGYSCTIVSVSQLKAKLPLWPVGGEPATLAAAPPAQPAALGAQNIFGAGFGAAPGQAQAIFAPHFGAPPPADQSTMRVGPADQVGAWRVTVPPRTRFTFSVEVLFTSLSRLDSAPVQLGAGMLLEAQETGDIEIQSEDGKVAYAHSAILVKVPYFSKQFSETWAKERWNLHHKLRCKMPCQATGKSVTSFLQYVYGNKHAVYEQDAVTLQELFSLGEACEVIELCRDVAEVTRIDSESLLGWIRWLKGEHVSAVSGIASKATAYTKQLLEAKDWSNVSAEALEIVVLGLQLVSEKS